MLGKLFMKILAKHGFEIKDSCNDTNLVIHDRQLGLENTVLGLASQLWSDVL